MHDMTCRVPPRLPDTQGYHGLTESKDAHGLTESKDPGHPWMSYRIYGPVTMDSVGNPCMVLGCLSLLEKPENGQTFFEMLKYSQVPGNP